MQRADALLTTALPEALHGYIIELKPYLLDSFGNATRIDYGTGHETNFIIFLRKHLCAVVVVLGCAQVSWYGYMGNSVR